MRKKILVALLSAFGLVPLLSGCWGYKEFDHQLYPHAIAVDYKDGEYTAYIQVLDMSELGKTESGGGQARSGTWIGVARGRTLDEAAHKLYLVTPRSLNWGHVNAFVFTTHVLDEPDWLRVFGVFTRMNQFRYTPWVFFTKETPQDLLSSQPILEKSPVYSGLGDPWELYNQSSFLRPLRFNTLLAQLREPTRPHLLLELAIERGRWSQPQDDQSHDTLTAEGYALLDRHLHYAGDMKLKEASGLRWADPKMMRSSINLYQNKKVLGSAVMDHTSFKVSEVRTARGIRYHIRVNVRGAVIERYGTNTLAELDKSAAAEIGREIESTYLKGLEYHVDVFGLEDHLYRHHPDWYESLGHGDTTSLTPSSIASLEVKVKLTTGMRTLEGLKTEAQS